MEQVETFLIPEVNRNSLSFNPFSLMFCRFAENHF